MLRSDLLAIAELSCSIMILTITYHGKENIGTVVEHALRDKNESKVV